ncbi:MetS family NSS transporter small subunit [Aquibacillus koreensis]|uniref:MetS family NSS transporter small subunit n=1 Tax=Aquibacillus koreensis TaxID=279446 RepID=A0A9X4AJJ0_9BACI|nr:MetS family NSS transporter small subunit [Aquibacillus koreensis]MCT2535912.1 MetS family NSS transporter small subunit [Aquibacillus koreensis]MDC3420368.1 MetS family NSS transporter small subunit [Aquibacillus koreensis]
MTVGAITMAVIGVVVIWGGLIASVVHAVRTSKQQ